MTITGTVTTGDVAAVTVQNASLSGGQKTISYTIVGGDTTTTIATALKNAINVDKALQAVGLQATSAANVLSLNPYTYFTGSSSGTETVTVSNANRGSAAITIGGTVTVGNTVTIVSHNPALAGGVKNSVYTVVSGDTLATIAKGLAALMNADANLQAIGTKVANSASLAWFQSSSGNALLPTGSSSVAVSAVDGGSNTKTNGYALSVNGGSTTNLTFDLNGNMTSDGTNSYAWDAEDRMIRITYPGANNFSTFVYDGYGRNVSIVETTAGSVTSTKQFVWAKDKMRPYQPCEERDGTGALTKKYFSLDQLNSTTKYFYDLDHLGSVREMTDNSGVVQAQYAFDPYGRVTKISEAVASDFGFGGYYVHSRSGLNLTLTRAYSSALGIFINRDSIGEVGGTNLFEYTGNAPTEFIDPSGRFWQWIPFIIIIPLLSGCKKAPPPKKDDDQSGQGQGQQTQQMPPGWTDNGDNTVTRTNPDGTTVTVNKNPDGGWSDPDTNRTVRAGTGNATSPLDGTDPFLQHRVNEYNNMQRQFRGK